MRRAPEFVDFPRAALERSIVARFEEIARRHPRQLALRSREHALTYAEAERAANRLAHAILARVGPGTEPVALLFDHDAPAVVAILAALKTGRPAVVLDPTHPTPRLAGTLDDAQARLVVGGDGHGSRAAELAAGRCAVLDGRDGGARPGQSDPPVVAIEPRSRAYISYTSGTTGAPKGVLADHRGVIHRAMAFVNSIGVGPGDRLTLFHGLGVGASLRHLWGGLLSGATVCLFDLRREGLGPIAEWIVAERITLCHFPASAFRHFAAGLAPGVELPDVRALTVSNEPVFPTDLELFRRHFAADAVFVIMLGVSEAGNVTQHVISPADPIPEDFMPIGFPLPDKQLLLLDDSGAPVTEGAAGEIAVRSEFLSPGYWRRPDLDRAKFLPDPDGGERRIYLTGDLGRWREDGALVHLGRKDAVPKLRGQFVDVLEIERRLVAHPAVSEAAVSIRESRPGDQRLIAYVAPVRAALPSGPELRRHARETLPAHMVPSAFVILSGLPRTSNGKVDRQALPAPGRARPELPTPALPPRTALERVLAALWADVLDLDEVGVEDDFFDLGGHSLLATRLCPPVSDTIGVELPLNALLEAGTVARMAVLLLEATLGGAPLAERARLLDEGAGGVPQAADRPDV